MIKQNKTVQLSLRLQTLADMVPVGKTVADVGCDHGFLDIFLVQTGKAESAIAMDVRKGPLSAAALHVTEAGLEDRIETRLSDGLSKLRPGEVQGLVCAGMGGPLMQEILTAYPEKTASLQWMLLQPQSEIREFRRFLREKGYRVLQERIVKEDGKFYFPMLVSPGAETGSAAADLDLLDLYDRFGERLIREKNPVLGEYLEQQERILGEILRNLQQAGQQNPEKESRETKKPQEESPEKAQTEKESPEKVHSEENPKEENPEKKRLEIRFREVLAELKAVQTTIGLLR